MRVIAPLLVLLFATTAANADFTYTFNHQAGPSGWSAPLSFTVPSYLTTSGVFAIPATTISGYTFTQGALGIAEGVGMYAFAFAPADRTIAAFTTTSTAGTSVGGGGTCNPTLMTPPPIILVCGGISGVSSGFMGAFFYGSPPTLPGTYLTDKYFSGSVVYSGDPSFPIGPDSMQITDNSVPEPASIVLLVTAMAGAAFVIRRRRM